MTHALLGQCSAATAILIPVVRFAVQGIKGSTLGGVGRPTGWRTVALVWGISAALSALSVAAGGASLMHARGMLAAAVMSILTAGGAVGFKAAAPLEG